MYKFILLVALTGAIQRSSYDNPPGDKSVKVIAPQSDTEDLHEDYLVKVKSHNLMQMKGDGEEEKKAEEPPKKVVSDKTVDVVPPGSERDELLSDYRAQIKSKKWKAINERQINKPKY